MKENNQLYHSKVELHSIKASANQEHFSLSLAIFDTIPIIFFCGNAFLISKHVSNYPFMIGITIIILAAIGKVIWKLVKSIFHKDLQILNRHFLPIMISGMCTMLIGLFYSIATDSYVFNTIRQQVSTFPSCIFFILSTIGLISLIIFRIKTNKKTFNTHSAPNWIGEIINSFTQIMLFIGLAYM